MTRPPVEQPPTSIGVVVHPVRDVAAPLDELRAWAARRGVSVVQVRVPGQTRQVAPVADAEGCDLIVSIGGDGTMLAAIRAGLAAGRPVLGVARGSLGVLAPTRPDRIAAALERYAAGDWIGFELPALVISRPDEPELLALNDLSVTRAGIGQIRVAAHVDGSPFASLAGDGVVVCTAAGSSAYSLAAGGPLLALDADAFVLTPLPTHGGSAPPLVLGPRSRLSLEIDPGYGDVRLELDGQAVAGAADRLQVALRPRVARAVTFADSESQLAVLRRRGILGDSPRLLAEEPRTAPLPDPRTREG